MNQYGDSLVNVFTVDKRATPDDTWNTAPRAVSLFGTVRFEAKRDEVVRRVINSGVCNQSMTWRFTIASDTKVGEVYFQEGPEFFGGQGLILTHNC